VAQENILIVEDDKDIREGVRILLESENYSVEEADCGKAGLEKLSETTDLVILDVMMPGMSGLKTCEEIRKVSNVPVLFLTAKSKESDKLIGLMAGGDDYLAKPFSYAELLGRVKALLRRYRIYRGKQEEETLQEKDRVIEIDRIRISEDFNEVTVDGNETELSDIEYRILLKLMKNPRRIFSAQNIYEDIWNEPFFYSSAGTVMVHIRNLRVKVEKDPQNPLHIKTVWGKGYRFE
jgi:two-component system OmpR family response regulator